MSAKRLSMGAVCVLLASVIFVFAALTGCKDDAHDAAGADAGEQTLTVSFTVGEVLVLHNNRTRPVRVGMQLGQGSVVQAVGEDAACTLQTPSGSNIRLEGNTELVLELLYKDDKLNIEKTGLDLVVGTVLVKTGTLMQNDELNVRTQTAVAGVRGTEFLVSHDEDGTDIAVGTGEVAVSRRVVFDLPEDLREHGDALTRVVHEETLIAVGSDQQVRISEAENQVYRRVLQDQLDSEIPGARQLEAANARNSLEESVRIASTRNRPAAAVTSPSTRHREILNIAETLGTDSEKAAPPGVQAAEPEFAEPAQRPRRRRPVRRTPPASTPALEETPPPDEIMDERFPR